MLQEVPAARLVPHVVDCFANGPLTAIELIERASPPVFVRRIVCEGDVVPTFCPANVSDDGVKDACGGGAVVVTSAQRARSLRKPPEYVLGVGQSVTHASISNMPDLTVTGAVAAGKAAYKMAKLGPPDVDAVELYDAFTINTILFLEDLGFCKKGEGGAFVEGGRIGPSGGLAVNTNGGGLSYCHPGMYGLLLLIEAVRQLRGECGARQVKDCEVALAHGNGGVLSSQATIILGTQATL